MQTVHFVQEVGPEDRGHIDGMLAILGWQSNNKSEAYIHSDVVACTSGVIALNDDPPLSIANVTERTGYVYRTVHRVVGSLRDAGFIEYVDESLNPVDKLARGHVPSLLFPKPEIYKAITMLDSWQRAVRVCILATHLDTTIPDAINYAVTANLDTFGINIPLGWPVK